MSIHQREEKKLERIASPDVGSIDFDDAFSVAFASGEMEVAPSIHLSSAGVSAVGPAVSVARPEVCVQSGPPKKNEEST